MGRLLSSAGRIVGAVLLAAHAAIAGCGVGGGGDGGDGAFTTVRFTNVDPSAALTEADFDYFDISGLANRVESFVVTPGFSIEFAFDEFESDNFFDVTLTWSDASTTTIPLLFVSGGEFTYPVAR